MVEGFLRELVAEPAHRSYCRCRTCAYLRYRNRRHAKGRLISKRSFFVYSLQDYSNFDNRAGLLWIIRYLASRRQPAAVRDFLAGILRAKNLYAYARTAGKIDRGLFSR